MKMVLINNIDMFGEKIEHITLNRIYECKDDSISNYLSFKSDDGISYAMTKNYFISLEEYKKQLIKQRYEQNI